MKYKIKKILLNQVTLSRMLSVHSDNGYIIISGFISQPDNIQEQYNDQ